MFSKQKAMENKKTKIIYLSKLFPSVFGVAGYFIWISILSSQAIDVSIPIVMLYGIIIWFVFSDKLDNAIKQGQTVVGEEKKRSIVKKFYLLFSMPYLLSGVSFIYLISVIAKRDLSMEQLSIAGIIMGVFFLFSAALLFNRLLSGIMVADEGKN